MTNLITVEQGSDVATCVEAANDAARTLGHLQYVVEGWLRSARRTLIRDLVDRHGLTDGQAEAVARYAARGLNDSVQGLTACRHGFESLADELATVLDEVNIIRKATGREATDTVRLAGVA